MEKVCGSILLLLFFVSASFAETVARNNDVYSITGRVAVDALSKGGFPPKISNVKVLLNGGEKATFIQPDGYFSFQDIPAGTYLIEVSAMGFFFSPVRVDVSARHHGKVQATLTENRRVLGDPMTLEPFHEEYYYEKREPFNVISLLKSPMGMMVGFMVLAVVFMPKLMENIDMEELKKLQEERQNQPTPSLTNMLQGRSN